VPHNVEAENLKGPLLERNTMSTLRAAFCMIRSCCGWGAFEYVGLYCLYKGVIYAFPGATETALAGS